MEQRVGKREDVALLKDLLSEVGAATRNLTKDEG
jgi:hypothetical protein